MIVATVSAVPLPDYTLYGSVTVNGNKLTKEDSNIISLSVDGKELVKFQMGDVNADAYVLKIPMNSEKTEGYARTGDLARIYVDGVEVDQSPVTIGDFGTTVKLDLTVSPEQQEQETQESTGTTGGGSSESSSRSHRGGGSSNEKETSKELINVKLPEQEEKKEEPEKRLKIEPKRDEEIKEITETEVLKQQKEETKKGFFEKLINLLGFGKEKITGRAVSELPSPKPLIGILIALVIIVVSLLIAYSLIFRGERE